MIIFASERVIRRFEPTVERGRENVSWNDFSLSADVQETSDTSAVGEEGGRRDTRLKVWSDEKLITDDQNAGTHADWLWHEGQWWKCVSSHGTRNTILSHYVSEFVRVPENEPEEHLAEPEVQIEAV